MRRFLVVIGALICVSGVWQVHAVAATADKDAPVAVVSHINVVSDKSQDVSSLEAWKRTYIKEGMTDEQKALAIWRTVVRYRHQSDPPCEFFGSEENVHDPLKTIHVYGYGMCCCASSNVDGLARYLGYQARCLGIGHMIAEVFYDNGWHMLDASLQNYFRTPEGKIASADDICAAVKPWLCEHPNLRTGGRADGGKLQAFAAGGRWKKEGPPLLATCAYFDDDGKGWGTHGWFSSMFYYDCKPGVYETYPSMGYQLNVQLRQGEKITRNWRLGGTIGGGDPVIITPAGQTVLRLQKSLGDKAPGRLGCGEMVYDVPLAGGAFRGGALKVDNLTSSAAGAGKAALAVADSAKDGELVIRFPSSYVYVSSPRKDKGIPATVELDAVLGDGGKVEAFFSDNHGLKWTPLPAVAAGKNTLDLDYLPFRRYDYLLKFVLKGAGTGLNALKVTNPFQCSQAALPTITEGENTIAFKAGPPEGTVTFEGNTLANAKWEWKQLTYLSFNPEVKNIAKGLARVQGKGDMTFTMPTPGDITRVRMNVGYRCRDLNDTWTIAMSFDGGKNFTDVEKITGPAIGYTKYIVYDKDIPKSAREVKIRLSGKEVNAACLFGLRMDADYLEPAGGFRPVKITYLWDEDGKEAKDEHVCSKAEETYKITCGAKAVVKSFTMELAK